MKPAYRPQRKSDLAVYKLARLFTAVTYAVCRSSTANMIHSVPRLISYISSIFTLEPGDLILTGTPEGVGPVIVGKELRAGITGGIEMSFSVAD